MGCAAGRFHAVAVVAEGRAKKWVGGGGRERKRALRMWQGEHKQHQHPNDAHARMLARCSGNDVLRKAALVCLRVCTGREVVVVVVVVVVAGGWRWWRWRGEGVLFLTSTTHWPRLVPALALRFRCYQPTPTWLTPSGWLELDDPLLCVDRTSSTAEAVSVSLTNERDDQTGSQPESHARPTLTHTHSTTHTHSLQQPTRASTACTMLGQ
jgi:hypothetical protein